VTTSAISPRARVTSSPVPGELTVTPTRVPAVEMIPGAASATALGCCAAALEVGEPELAGAPLAAVAGTKTGDAALEGADVAGAAVG